MLSVARQGAHGDAGPPVLDRPLRYIRSRANFTGSFSDRYSMDLRLERVQIAADPRRSTADGRDSPLDANQSFEGVVIKGRAISGSAAPV